ncbi:hypothetical protein SAMN05444413_104243 [Roseivivax marinus]|uniref:hypothetical protein n=1 Tax=Roseivivax marinus TaxID=1379903 RepID=UPI0008CCA973|nr:hypothetical protein [Roseivivax marinus]SEK94722.1 hypothetical protein SAMN05444413_104243 [Roseivivax marinus]
MSSPSHYRCEKDVVHLLENKKLSLSALRLVHATNHYLDNHPGWHATHMNLADNLGQNRVCTALCSILCQTTGSPGANDIGMIHEGMRDLQDADLFRVLELDGRKLRFRYSHSLAEAATIYKKPKFAMLDCSIIAGLRSPSQVYFYTLAEMVQRQRQPTFYIPRVCPQTEPWSQTKRTWLAAACRIGKLLGHDYVFIPELDDQCEQIVAVKVKIVHHATQWSPLCLFPRRAVEPVSIVANGKSRTLTRQELGKRSRWTSVSGSAPVRRQQGAIHGSAAAVRTSP